MPGRYRLRRFPRFVLTNSLGTIVDNLVLWVLSHYIFTTYAGQYIVSPVLSFECAVFTNFICSWHFVWNDRVKQRKGSRLGYKYIYYNLSATGTFCVKMMFLLLLEYFLGWGVVICNLMALCISGTINFVMGEWVIFRKAKK